LDVANRAGIGIATVKRFEGGQSIASTSLVAIKRALEDAGAIFLADGEDGGNGGPGVRLRKETE
jgi:cell division GTPase FtsZ